MTCGMVRGSLIDVIEINYLPYIHKPGFDNRRNPPGSSDHMDNLECILELFTSREMYEISKYQLLNLV